MMVFMRDHVTKKLEWFCWIRRIWTFKNRFFEPFYVRYKIVHKIVDTFKQNFDLIYGFTAFICCINFVLLQDVIGDPVFVSIGNMNQ